LNEKPLVHIIDSPVYPLEKVVFSKLVGILLGGFLFGFLTITILLIRKIIKDIL